MYQNSPGRSSCIDCSGQLTSPQGAVSCSGVQQCSGFSILSGTTRAFKVLALPKSFNHWEARSYVSSQYHSADLASVDSSQIITLLTTDSNFNPNQDVWVGLYHNENLAFQWYSNRSAQNLSWCDGYPKNSDGHKHGAVLTGSGCLQDTMRGYMYNFAAIEIEVSRCGSFCAPGTIVDNNSSSCVSCPSGKYSRAYGESACSSCLIGEFALSPGLSSCAQCETGKFSSISEGSSCLDCPQGAWTKTQGATAVSDCICKAKSYGKAFLGLNCTTCVSLYQECGENSTKPFILPGYWFDLNSQSVFACDPPFACLSTGYTDQTTCAPGYTGRKCGLCIQKLYFRLNGECKSCANEAIKWVFFVSLLVLLCYSLLRVSRMKGLRIPYDVRVAYSWMQVISLFPFLFSSWPQKLLNLMRFLSFTNLDLDLVSPGMLVV
jgi:hypothetical protein